MNWTLSKHKQLIRHRQNTEADWKAMRERFFREWNEAHEITLEHYGGYRAMKVTDYFYAHACRMIDERWPDVD